MPSLNPLGARVWVAAVLAGAEAAMAAPDLPAPELTQTGNYMLQNWRTEHGLPQASPRAIVQTQDGYLWVGTFNGLARFDGLRFSPFTVANTPELPSDNINVLYEDRSGILWIGTEEGGLVCYEEGRFRPVPAVDHAPTDFSVAALCEDSEGTLWVGTSIGLYRLAGNQIEPARLRDELQQPPILGLCFSSRTELRIATDREIYTRRDGVVVEASMATPKPVHSIDGDATGIVWVAFQAGGIAFIEPGTTALNPAPGRWKASTFHRARDGTLWAGTSTGSLRRFPEGGSAPGADVAQFPGLSISALHQDRDGNFWVGADGGGLWRLRERQVTLYSTQQGLRIPAITSMAEDREGRVWVGTFGKGLHVWQGERFDPVSIAPTAVNLTTVLEGHRGEFWCGTYSGNLFRRFDSGEFRAEPTASQGSRTLFQDREGALWVGTRQEGVERRRDGQATRYTTQQGLCSDHIRAITQDRAGAIWIGTLRGLNRLQGERIESFNREEGLGVKEIRTLYVDSEGILWIGSVGGGLARWSGGHFDSVTTRQGLIDDWIEQIVEDDLGNLWLGSNAGLMRLSLRELNDCASGRIAYLHGTAIRREEGLPVADSGTGFQPSCLRARDGRLWFGTSAGIVVVDPRRIAAASSPPPVHLEEVQVDGKAHSVYPARPTALAIPPRTQRLEFRFTGLDLSAPATVRFRYKLEGLDPDWVNAGTRREAVYTHVPPGNYQFRVVAANNKGAWNNAGASLALIVIPPWWQTWWFRIAFAVCFAGLIFGLHEYRLRHLRKAHALQESLSRHMIESQEVERKRLANDLHDSLGQSLQIIKGRAELGLKLAGEQTACLGQLQEISQTVTRAIHEVRAISHALRPAELDQLGLAKALEWLLETAAESSGIRFERDLLTRNGTIPADAEIHLFRIAQEAVSNILKHARASEVMVELKSEGRRVWLSFLDNGCGLPAPESPGRGPVDSGLGLASIAERARLLGGSLDLQSAPGRGTRLTVSFPISSNPHAQEDQSPDRR